MTGTRLLWPAVSAQKNFMLGERFRLQLRWDFKNPKKFGKLLSDQRTANIATSR